MRPVHRLNALLGHGYFHLQRPTGQLNARRRFSRKASSIHSSKSSTRGWAQTAQNIGQTKGYIPQNHQLFPA